MAQNVPVNRVRFLIPFLKQYQLKGGLVSDFQQELGVSTINEITPSDVLSSVLINSLVNKISDEMDDPYLGHTVGKQLINDNLNPFTQILIHSDSLLTALSQLVLNFDTESAISEYNLLINKDYVIIYGDRSQLLEGSTWQADSFFCTFVATAILSHLDKAADSKKVIIKLPHPEAIPPSAPFTVIKAFKNRLAIQFPSNWLNLSSSTIKSNAELITEEKISIDFTSRVNEYIASNINNLSMELAAQFCGVSKLELRAQLQRKKNDFSSLVLEYRMKVATTLLLNQSLSIDLVAAEVGYSNTPNFIRSFKKHFGITPLKYRKTNS
ncbi:helix-turn-helix transcriptional regulator [Vibrio coralliirubri]|uniref:helix-turn-helix transcriptional regulator n=1 Tax=Vibrio coralliirubri TaxID=1516159 RepID=UPI00062EFE2C|nr:AraC family transcriptional regulator [Vibrio coralliirubri]CDT12409.1 hypothetical protein VCR6J2_230115 [Vibrio coralliirubri]CDT30960.1 hypothetical protein VCR1J2_400006 [Vibrio coralliirubri]CDT84471.1 hypothetical protein VCR26J2_410006 [Vibrio coralliirubri]CDT98903.1 hypothetical protein VCR8J2_60006 [Vibrio coralliirubri]